MFYETPQFIRQEVKLMGLITFTQLWILLGAGGVIAFFYLLHNYLLLLISAIFVLPLGIITAFGQMNGIPMYKIIPAALRHFWLPKYYFWQKNDEFNKQLSLHNKTSQETPTPIIKKTPLKQLDQQTLNNLSQFLDQ